MRVYESKIVYSLVSLGDDVRLDDPRKVVGYLQSLYAENPLQEQFVSILLDRKNHPICRHLVTLGTLTGSLVHPREVFRSAILAGAASIIISHNHPSGDPAPSSADIQATRRLREAGQTLDIEITDHVIVGTPEGDPAKLGHYSFREAGLL